MAGTATQEPLSLSNLCEGKLEEMFQSAYPAIVSQLKHGDTGTINITIKLKRVENTETMVNVTASLTPKFPAKSKATIASISADCKLMTEKLPEPQGRQLKIVQNGGIE